LATCGTAARAAAEVVPTGRRALYLYQPGERASEFAQRTRQSAVEFINEGSLEELFVLLFSDQDDADAGERSVASGQDR
jgi:hypothetical protein